MPLSNCGSRRCPSITHAILTHPWPLLASPVIPPPTLLPHGSCRHPQFKVILDHNLVLIALLQLPCLTAGEEQGKSPLQRSICKPLEWQEVGTLQWGGWLTDLVLQHFMSPPNPASTQQMLVKSQPVGAKVLPFYLVSPIMNVSS